MILSTNNCILAKGRQKIITLFPQPHTQPGNLEAVPWSLRPLVSDTGISSMVDFQQIEQSLPWLRFHYTLPVSMHPFCGLYKRPAHIILIISFRNLYILSRFTKLFCTYAFSTMVQEQVRQHLPLTKE